MKFLGHFFTNGFKSSHMHKFPNLKNLSKNISELKFYQDQNKRIHDLLPIKISRNDE